jgi:hypothetical protein
MVDINEVLTERGKTHGDYAVHATTTQALKRVMCDGYNWDRLTPSMKEALEMVQHKVGRILSGNPEHEDHWDDIAGYATLVVKELRAAKAPTDKDLPLRDPGISVCRQNQQGEEHHQD